MAGVPQFPPDQCKGIRESRASFGIPGCSAHGANVRLQHGVRHQRHERIQPEQGGGSPADRQVIPLPLGLKAQMRPGFFQGLGFLFAGNLDHRQKAFFCFLCLLPVVCSLQLEFCQLSGR
jgi:hypothetical protein